MLIVKKQSRVIMYCRRPVEGKLRLVWTSEF